MAKNEFAKISQIVEDVIKHYRCICQEYHIPDDAWHSSSVESLAKPFINGYFTLAVVGKDSSGKSTFINALLGCKDLLPTGRDQTISGRTYIEYGDTPEVFITFGNGSVTTIKGDDIAGKIKPYVSILEKYHDLPVNSIDNMILRGFSCDRIWDLHTELEERTLCALLLTKRN